MKNLPQDTIVIDAAESALDGAFVQVGKKTLGVGKLTLDLPKPGRWLALYRPDFYWNVPRFGGKSWEGVPRDTQFLLWEKRGGKYGVFLPLISGDLRARLAGTAGGLELSWDGLADGQKGPESALLGYFATGGDPYALIADGVAAVSQRLRSFRTREEKVEPAFVDYLGWCTWDAFYHDVTAEKYLEGLRTFSEGGVAPGFSILDDGWLDTTKDYLNSIFPNKTKFPNGLAPLALEAKRRYGIKLFGVWHNFMAYWMGVNPEGSVAKEFKYVSRQGKIRPWLGKDEPLEDLHLIHPDSIHRFYHQFYRYLREQGVDLVKVDGQSALEEFSSGHLGRVSTMRAYQEALQGAASAHLGGELLHCMCNGSDVAYNMDASSGWRNSVDYFPRHDGHTQQRHVFINAYNNLWSSQFAVPDWDMFQTHGASPKFHAAARAISGGPVYVSDKPGQQDFALLKRLVISDSRVLRYEQPALPSPSVLLTDCTAQAVALKLYNRHRDGGQLGLFHCQKSETALSDTFGVADVPGLDADGKYALWFAEAQSLDVLDGAEGYPFALEPVGHELVTLSPIEKGVAILGLLDKYSGLVAVAEAGWETKSTYAAALLDGGRIGFYSAKKPKKVVSTATGHKVRYDAKAKLLEIIAPEGEPLALELHY